MNEVIPSPLSRSQQARRERILDAAQSLFGQTGLKATTMEAIAKTAGISKPTLYAYFSDKEQVLHASAMRIADRMQHSAETAFALNTDAISRITLALQERMEQIYDLIIGSPFADDLYAVSTPTVIARFVELEDFYRRHIAMAIDNTMPELQGQGDTLASLILRASDGLKKGTPDKQRLLQDVAVLVRGVLQYGVGTTK